MPELPEVETVKKVLTNKIVNKKIIDIDILFDKLLKNTTKEEFTSTLKNQKIKEIKRYGKYLIISLEKNDVLIHLRMEGKLFYYDKKEDITKHDHIIFYFSDGSILKYNDVRKFGTFDLLNKEEYLKYPKVKKLGLEPNSKEMNVDYLKNKLEKSNKKIKVDLLDQTIVNGLGNIYVDEVLFASKIHPESISKNLNNKDLENIVINSKIIINKAIEKGGTTIKSFAASDQIKGSFQDYLKVYKKKDQKCTVCNATIQKIVVGGRGTHFCPKCQRKK